MGDPRVTIGFNTKNSPMLDDLGGTPILGNHHLLNLLLWFQNVSDPFRHHYWTILDLHIQTDRKQIVTFGPG